MTNEDKILDLEKQMTYARCKSEYRDLHNKLRELQQLEGIPTISDPYVYKFDSPNGGY